MDWTGGVRRRYAPGKNGAIVQKQKAHFAKARAALQSTPSSHSTFKPSFSRSDAHGNAKSTARTRKQIIPKYGQTRHAASERRKLYSSDHPGSVKGHIHDPNKEAQDNVRDHESKPDPPTVVSITSGSRSSRSASVDYGRSAKQSRHSSSPAPVQGSRLSQEERLLLANRRRLLARTDWLGLSAIRPVQIKFPRSRDKDRIGKRRKIEKAASRKGEAAGRRLLTPLFQDHHQQGDHLMSGALQADDIQIKIGTDALASQTLRSRQSRTPGKTSIRHPSTEFGPLSEESMLLGADGDSFEELDHPGKPLLCNEFDSATVESQVAVAGSQVTNNMQHVPLSADMRQQFQGEDPYHHLQPPLISQVDEPGEVGPVLLIPNSEEQEHWQPALGGDPGFEILKVHGPAATAPMDLPQMPQYSTPQLQATNSQIRDERAWRQLCNIDAEVQSDRSVKALKSSSLHDETTDSSIRPVLDYGVGSAYGTHPDQRQTPPTNKNHVNGPSESIPLSQSINLQSPSASLAQITRFAKQPAVVSKQNVEERNDDALWRQFIIGSQDSSEEADEYRAPSNNQTDARKHASTATTSSNFFVSGLGTSDRSTAGDTLFITSDTPSAMSRTLDKRKHELSPRRNVDDAVAQTSIVAKGNYEVTKADSIEDDPEPRRHRDQTGLNIHTPTTTTILNTKRFKRPNKKITHTARGSSRFLPSKKARPRANKQDRSIYDLVDSDDMSVY